MAYLYDFSLGALVALSPDALARVLSFCDERSLARAASACVGLRLFISSRRFAAEYYGEAFAGDVELMFPGAAGGSRDDATRGAARLVLAAALCEVGTDDLMAQLGKVRGLLEASPPGALCGEGLHAGCAAERVRLHSSCLAARRALLACERALVEVVDACAFVPGLTPGAPGGGALLEALVRTLAAAARVGGVLNRGGAPQRFELGSLALLSGVRSRFDGDFSAVHAATLLVERMEPLLQQTQEQEQQQQQQQQHQQEQPELLSAMRKLDWALRVLCQRYEGLHSRGELLAGVEAAARVIGELSQQRAAAERLAGAVGGAFYARLASAFSLVGPLLERARRLHELAVVCARAALDLILPPPGARDPGQLLALSLFVSEVCSLVQDGWRARSGGATQDQHGTGTAGRARVPRQHRGRRGALRAARAYREARGMNLASLSQMLARAAADGVAAAADGVAEASQAYARQRRQPSPLAEPARATGAAPGRAAQVTAQPPQREEEQRSSGVGPTCKWWNLTLLPVGESELWRQVGSLLAPVEASQQAWLRWVLSVGASLRSTKTMTLQAGAARENFTTAHFYGTVSVSSARCANLHRLAVESVAGIARAPPTPTQLQLQQEC